MTLLPPIGHPTASASRWCGPEPGFQQLEFPIGNVLYQTTGGIGSPAHFSQRRSDRLLGTTARGCGGVGSVATVDMKGNKKTLTQFWLGSVTGLAWSSSGDEILFTAAAYGFTTSLYAVNRSGRQRLIAHLPGNFAVLDVAPDGRLLMSRTVAFERAFLSADRGFERDRSVLARLCLCSAIFPAMESPYCSLKVGMRPGAVRIM